MAATTQGAPVAKRIVVVDDEEALLGALKRLLTVAGWEVHTATNGAEALPVIDRVRPQLVLSDYRMPGMTGAELLARVKDFDPDVQRILLTGHADERSMAEAVNRSEVFRFVAKPWDNNQLQLTVQAAFDHYQVIQENRRLHEVTQAQNEELRGFTTRLEAKVAERTQQLSHAKAEWEASFDAIDQPLAIVGADLKVQRANKAYAQLGGHPVQEIGQKPVCHKFLFGSEEPCPGCPLAASLRAASPQHADVVRGERTWVLTTYPIAGSQQAVCTYRDVTEERILTRKLVEAEKMSVVGRLAGGVAHEINNPLGAILAFAQILRREQPRSADDEEGLAVIEEAALRCKHIVDSLLKFSRESSADHRRATDLTRCLQDAVVLFQTQLKGAPRAKLVMELDGEAPPVVMGNAIQLGQVALNLMQNALHALPQGTGTIRVTTGVDAGRGFFAVSDDGRGIPPENLGRIFDPWFTTMPAGSGPGLGLAISRRIVESHGGEISVKSAVGGGSTFVTSFPLLESKAGELAEASHV